MIPPRVAVLYTAGLLVAFAAGRMSMPAPALGTAGQSADGANRSTGLPTSLVGRPVKTAGETWLDAAVADAAAVRGAGRPGEANQVLLGKLDGALAMSDPVERLARWSALLPLMRLEDARAVRAMLLKNIDEGRGFTLETIAFWKRCGRMDLATALTWVKEEGWNAQISVLSGWACEDSAAALAWIEANSNLPDLTGRGAGMVLTSLVNGLTDQSPEAAIEFLLTNADDPIFDPCLHMAADIAIQRDGIPAAWQWFKGVADSNAPARLKAANFEELLSRTHAELDESRKMELAQTVSRYAGEPWFSRYAASDLGRYMGELDPVEGAAVMERFRDAEAKKYFMEPFLGRWMATDAASLGSWLESNRASPAFDTMASSLAKHLSEEDPEAARGWAAQISDPVGREALEKELVEDQETAPDGASVVQ